MDRFLSQRYVEMLKREKKEEGKEVSQLICIGTIETTMENDKEG